MHEWIIGEAPDREALYVVHTTEPRFVAALSDFEDGSYGVHQVWGLDGLAPGRRRAWMGEAGIILSQATTR